MKMLAKDFEDEDFQKLIEYTKEMKEKLKNYKISKLLDCKDKV